MGRTYAAKKGGRTFDVNYAGADVLGFVHKAAGKGLAKITKEEQEIFWAYRPPCTTYSMTEEEALECADAIEKVDLTQLVKDAEEDGWLWENMWEGTPEELAEWVQDWVDFLRESGGYEVY